MSVMVGILIPPIITAVLLAPAPVAVDSARAIEAKAVPQAIPALRIFVFMTSPRFEAIADPPYSARQEHIALTSKPAQQKQNISAECDLSKLYLHCCYPFFIAALH
ncbi:hypothetical protein [Mycolicibacterium chlorophenolicum]|uniref:hypothetical protein n=1 Tax=Mycolicibacterium chlorophenolicum TaxID=37916 RepID=UPI001F438980|nr:hypothetical protein [Mycolicibacterium chlorophenolicum]